MIFGKNWKCWVLGHRARKYRSRRGAARVTVRVCRRGCGVVE